MGVQLEYGEVSAVDYLTCRIRVRLDERDGVETFWLNVPQRNAQGTKSRPLMPEIGEQVAVLLDDDGVGGVYLGGIYSTAEPPPVVDDSTAYVRFRDGTVMSYDCGTGVMTVDCVGKLLVKCATEVTVKAGASIAVEAGMSLTVKAPAATLEIPQVSLKGNLQVVGNINATGTIMDVGGNSNHHTH